MNCFQISTLLVESQLFNFFPSGASVVNCFQISTLLVESQRRLLLALLIRCCELLSNQYFTSRITAKVILLNDMNVL